MQRNRDFTGIIAGMPILPLPVLSEAQLSLSKLVGEMYDCAILPGDAMRPLLMRGVGFLRPTCSVPVLGMLYARLEY